MPTPAIIRGSDQFFVTNYYGNGGGQKVGKFQPFTDSGTIAKSCTFNSPDSARLSRTPSGTGTSKKTFTISAWIKRGRLINASSEHSMTIHGVFHGGSGRYGVFGLYNGGSGNPTQLRLLLGKYTSGSSTTTLDWYTNRTLEDTSKWYHVMAVVDTTNATAGDRVKLYIDGDRVTSFASSFAAKPGGVVATLFGGLSRLSTEAAEISANINSTYGDSSITSSGNRLTNKKVELICKRLEDYKASAKDAKVVNVPFDISDEIADILGTKLVERGILDKMCDPSIMTASGLRVSPKSTTSACLQPGRRGINPGQEYMYYDTE